MLTANLLLFSRTLTNDYRWLCCDSSLDQNDRDHILSDYREFEKDRGHYLNERHLIVRHVQNGIAIYRFIETGKQDQESRNIFALAGYVFSSFDYTIVQTLLQFIVSYLFFKIESTDFTQLDISDSAEEIIVPMEISLDDVIDRYKEGNEVNELSEKTAFFIKEHQEKAFIINSKCINLLPAENAPPQSQQKYKDSINGMLNGAESSKVPASIPSQRTNSQKCPTFPQMLICTLFKKRK